jgi:hypothetical protein
MREYILGEIDNEIMKIRIFLRPRDVVRWFRILGQLEPRARLYVGDEMQRLCANDYVNQLRSNSYNQRLMQGWSRATRGAERYEDWKAEHGFPLGFWRLKDDLLNNLSYFRVHKGWMGGIQNGIMDSGGKSWLGAGDVGPSKEIAWYARMNEYGIGPTPKRPIFYRTMNSYAQSRQRQRRGIEALRRTVMAWSN